MQNSGSYVSFTDHPPIHSLILQTSYITIVVHPAINHVLPDDISYFTGLKYYLLNGMYEGLSLSFLRSYTYFFSSFYCFANYINFFKTSIGGRNVS